MISHQGLFEFDLPLAELRRYRPDRVEPADFDAFWAATLSEAQELPLGAEIVRVETPLTFEIFSVRFAGYGGDPIHGWLIKNPARSPPQSSCVIKFLGYGTGRGHALDHLEWPSVGRTTLVIETRGQGGPGPGGATADPHGSEPHVPGWLTRGIEDPFAYYYRRVFVDAVRAVAVARSHARIAAERVVVSGTSQGGGIALAAAALTPVEALVSNLPFGCHFDRAVRITDEAPYGEVATYLRVYRDRHERVLRTLSYFDGMHFAARATAPALFSAALMDRVCPPSTVFAACNHYAGETAVHVWPFNGHEGGETDQHLESVAFVTAVLGQDDERVGGSEPGVRAHGAVRAVSGHAASDPMRTGADARAV